MRKLGTKGFLPSILEDPPIANLARYRILEENTSHHFSPTYDDAHYALRGGLGPSRAGAAKRSQMSVSIAKTLQNHYFVSTAKMLQNHNFECLWWPPIVIFANFGHSLLQGRGMTKHSPSRDHMDVAFEMISHDI